MSFLKTRTENQILDSITQSLPRGKLFFAKNIEGSNLRDLLKGLIYEIARIENKISKEAYEQYFINEGNGGMLTDWEREYGIPDNCFKVDGVSEENRINNVIIKSGLNEVVTEDDYIDLGSLLGINLRLEHMSNFLFPPYDVPFFPVNETTSRFVLIIYGDDIVGGFPPYDVPFLPVGFFSIVECLFNKIKPANAKYLYLNN